MGQYNVFRSGVEKLERKVSKLGTDVVVLRASHHELSSRIRDDMV
jgi:hypothetical protein